MNKRDKRKKMESDTVLQCVGIEYYIKSGANGYLRYSEGSMMVYDVF